MELVPMKRRWYDQEPACERILGQLQGIVQPEAQLFCGRLLQRFAEQIRKQIQRKNEQGFTSIGLQGIEGLYKFRNNQRRWYDGIPAIQQAVAALYTLPVEGLVALGFSVGDTFKLVAIYAQVCHELEEPPVAQDMVNISQKALNEGEAVAIDFVKLLIGDDLFDALYSNPT